MYSALYYIGALCMIGGLCMHDLKQSKALVLLGFILFGIAIAL